jgi:hypothetical protein
MAAKVELTPEEARNWRLAKLFDLRSFIGSLFVIFGVLVTIAGIAASPATIDKAAGINLGLWVGLIMLAMGLLFLAWVLLKPAKSSEPKAPAATRRGRRGCGSVGLLAGWLRRRRRHTAGRWHHHSAGGDSRALVAADGRHIVVPFTAGGCGRGAR